MASVVEPGERVVVPSMRRGPMTGLRLVGMTLRSAWRHRVLGLAAEAGFWQLLSLPSLILAVLGVLGYFSGVLGAANVDHLQRSIDNALKHVILPSAVDSTVAPALHRILFGGRADVVSISFVVSLWTGSSAMATYVNTLTIAYGMRSRRGAVRSRVVALLLYVGFVLASIVLLPLLVLGPSHLVSVFPDSWQDTVGTLTVVGYWPIAILLSLSLLASLYHLAVPGRPPWRRALPGAVVAVVIWVLGSLLLRLWLEFAFRKTATYGPLSAPVAVLLFLYLTALAILLGAELNAAIERTWPQPDQQAAS